MRWETLFFLAEKTACEAGVTLHRIPDFAGDTEYSSATLREARLRCAISRAYYAAFNEARKWWNHEFPTDVVTQNSAHNDLILKLERRREWVVVSENLRELSRYRKKADYDEAIANLDQTTVFVIKLSNTLLSDIGDLQN